MFWKLNELKQYNITIFILWRSHSSVSLPSSSCVSRHNIITIHGMVMMPAACWAGAGVLRQDRADAASYCQTWVWNCSETDAAPVSLPDCFICFEHVKSDDVINIRPEFSSLPNIYSNSLRLARIGERLLPVADWLGKSQLLLYKLISEPISYLLHYT